ncbi:hypothetical protein D3C78_486990 [compost metagenome]
MASIAQSVRLLGQCIASRVGAWVSLDDSTARGIHMSRLYLALEPLAREELTPCLLDRVLGAGQSASRRQRGDRLRQIHRGVDRQAVICQSN